MTNMTAPPSLAGSGGQGGYTATRGARFQEAEAFSERDAEEQNPAPVVLM